MPENQTRKVLIVEDEPDMRMLIAIMLSLDPRMQVVGEASDGLAALELARGQQPDLIILDHQIEGDVMGLQASSLLKEAAPASRILLYSAFDLAAEAAAQPAITECLRKGQVDKLVETCRRLLSLAEEETRSSGVSN